MSFQRIKALLLLGPTGSGKSPLGKELEKRGLSNLKCHHFDFGENLRKVASGEIPFPEEEKNLIKQILEEGRLLKPEEFYLADELLKAFLEIRKFSQDSLLILNGLPRNLYQAERLREWILVEYLVHLHLDERTLKARLTKDPAGDRAGREDDQEELVKRKLKWFREANLPLLDYYASNGVKLVELKVLEEDTGFTLYQRLQGFLSLL